MPAAIVKKIMKYGPKKTDVIDPNMDDTILASGIAGTREEIWNSMSIASTKVQGADAAMSYTTATNGGVLNEVPRSMKDPSTIEPGSPKAFARPSKLVKRNLLAVKSKPLKIQTAATVDKEDGGSSIDDVDVSSLVGSPGIPSFSLAFASASKIASRCPRDLKLISVHGSSDDSSFDLAFAAATKIVSGSSLQGSSVV